MIDKDLMQNAEHKLLQLGLLCNRLAHRFIPADEARKNEGMVAKSEVRVYNSNQLSILLERSRHVGERLRPDVEENRVEHVHAKFVHFYSIY